MKNVGNPGRRFLAASPLVFVTSPLCVLALKLLKKLLKEAGNSFQHFLTAIIEG